MSEYGHKVQVWSADWDAAHARIAALESLLAEANKLNEAIGYAETRNVARARAAEARCVAAEQAEANAFRNRDSAVAENEKFRAMLEKIEGSSRPHGEPAWQYDEIRALLGMPTASETPAERVCSHPIEEYMHHGFVSGKPNDFRCTICNTVVNFSPDQVAAWHDIRSTANRGTVK